MWNMTTMTAPIGLQRQGFHALRKVSERALTIRMELGQVSMDTGYGTTLELDIKTLTYTSGAECCFAKPVLVHLPSKTRYSLIYTPEMRGNCVSFLFKEKNYAISHYHCALNLQS